MFRDEMQDDPSDEKIAWACMETIMYDNGWVNRLEPERFSPKWTRRIAPLAGAFFKANPDLLNKQTVENMCTGDYDENQSLYSHLPGYSELDAVLNQYFEDGGQS